MQTEPMLIKLSESPACRRRLRTRDRLKEIKLVKFCTNVFDPSFMLLKDFTYTFKGRAMTSIRNDIGHENLHLIFIELREQFPNL